jgi:hypothetical protein
MSRSRERRYYDDSDDMVERIRRAREAFEKRTKAFQGPDWPYYEKRVIVGQKKKEDMDLAHAQTSSAASGNAEANPVPAETGSSADPEPTQPAGQDVSTAADDTSAWWAAQRAAQKSSKTAQDSPPAADESQDLEDGADS